MMVVRARRVRNQTLSLPTLRTALRDPEICSYGGGGGGGGKHGDSRNGRWACILAK